MKRRNVEGNHEFAKFVADQCGIYELGGLLLDRNWDFTAAVEAFELTQEESRQSLFSLFDLNGYTEGLYMTGLFAQELDIPFFIFTHVQNKPLIHVYSMYSYCKGKKMLCRDQRSLTEDGFIQWWQEVKGTVQTKPYRSDFIKRAKTSYFDNLLESRGLKWGGNVDGYLIADNYYTSNIIAVIENRFTNKIPLKKYDPNEFYTGYNGSDYYTWLPLIELKDKLEVPLFLMTYSYREGEQNQVGITQILGQSEDGLQYVHNNHGVPVRPCDNIFQNVSDIKNWLLRAL